MRGHPVPLRVAHEFEDRPPEHIDSVADISRDRLREGTLVLPKGRDVPPPAEWGFGLEPSALSFPLGADTVYRDSRATHSIQVREYDDRYTVQLDHANPEQGRLLEHLFRDIGPRRRTELLLAAAVVVGLALLAVFFS